MLLPAWRAATDKTSTVFNMGMFDTVHTPSRCTQVKCFGKSLSNLRFGDVVVLHRLVDELTPDHTVAQLYSGVAQQDQTYQILVSDGTGFLVVTDGVLTAWVSSYNPALVCFDSHGRKVEDTDVRLALGEVALRGTLCSACAEF